MTQRSVPNDKLGVRFCRIGLFLLVIAVFAYGGTAVVPTFAGAGETETENGIQQNAAVLRQSQAPKPRRMRQTRQTLKRESQEKESRAWLFSFVNEPRPRSDIFAVPPPGRAPPSVS
jgi:hypothetical protein